MTRARVVDPSLPGRDRILLAAERLVAERGLGVPLRDVAVAAGQKNHSAVHYHFGDRDGLIEAVVTYRVATLEARRLELLARLEADGRADDVHGLLDALARPMFEIPLRDGASHYARFLDQVRGHPAVRALGDAPQEGHATARILSLRIGRALTHLPGPARTARLVAVATALFGLLADHERAREARRLSAAEEEAAFAELLAMLTGMLLAPAAGRARRSPRR